MRAVLYRRCGDAGVLELAELAEPRPGPGELLVRVRAAALNPKDVLVRKGRFWPLVGTRFPLSCGYDFAGEVAAHGAGVGTPALGARVYGMVNALAGRTCAELVAVRADELAALPPSLSFVEAAALPLAALTALQALRDHARLRRGQTVCVNGATGGVGSAAVQLARALGAAVIAVSSSANAQLCAELGATRHVAHERGDALAAVGPVDAFFDAFGNRSFAAVRALLPRGGTYVTTLPRARILVGAAAALVAGRRARLVLVRSRRADLERLAAHVAAGELRAVIDSVYALEEVADAHRRVETRRVRGKVVVEVARKS